MQELKFLLDQSEKTLNDKNKSIEILKRIIRLLGEEPGEEEKDFKELERKLLSLKSGDVIEEKVESESEGEDELNVLKYDENGDLIVF